MLAVIWLAGYELLWRKRGYTPTLNDNEALWCHARANVAADGVVIIGSSRLQTGLDPAVLSHELGDRHVTSLALAGANPIPTLLDVARDRSFHGLIVVEYMPRRLFTPDSWSANRSSSYLAACSNPSLIAPIEAAMGRALQRRFVFLLIDVQPISVISYVARHGALPGATQGEVRDDRFNPVHFGRDPQETTVNEYWATPLTEAELNARAAELRDAIAKLRARGGNVVLYRPPVSGAVLADEEGRFPAATWLPRIAGLVGVQAVDFAAVPELRDVTCPDGEHPDADQVPAITTAVARELAKLSTN